jgi:predicted nucleic acid-binding protein
MAAAATELLVIDTDVLIDYLRDQPQAVAFLEGSDRHLAASVVSIAELYVGVREGAERQRLDVFVSAFEVLALGQEAAVQAGLFRRQYGRSHGTGLADALIAAIVQTAGATLATLNRRHFPMLANVVVPYTKES